MPLNEGTGDREFTPTVDHIQNGEQGNQDNLSRPSLQLEERTNALKDFTQDLEELLNASITEISSNTQRIVNLEGQSTASDLANHVADDTRHTVYASEAETRAGGETQKVISADTYKTITDERILPFYDAIVGNQAIAGIDYGSLKDAVDAASDGWKILVTQDEFVNATIDIVQNNIEIDFRRGASLLQGSANTAINITGNDCYISKGRFVGFTTSAINVSNGTLRTMLRDLRFNSNGTNVTDLGSGTTQLGNITE
jgi:hypothetical protein